MNETIIQTRDGQPKIVKYLDPMWCSLSKTRVRFVKQHEDKMIEVADNNGNPLPDFRHPSQLLAY
jgi:hypothetical protein